MKWPVVVNCRSGLYVRYLLPCELNSVVGDDGQAAVGDVEGVKGILESLRRKRDGEDTSEDVQKPRGWFF